jgi:DEAD/DEAH box helicase domain-containing protein
VDHPSPAERSRALAPRSTAALVGYLASAVAGRYGRPEQVLVHARHLPERPPTGAALRPRLPDALGQALRAQGIRMLYPHQVAAIQAARTGQSVVVTTPTASGKTLCFNLPVLERLLAGEGPGHALYLYPTKALMADQRRSLDALLAGLGPSARAVRVAELSGDVPPAARVGLRRDPPEILLANPDIVHFELLAKHGAWQRFLRGLAFVVIDELHAYRGVFGAHVGLILRRLRRLAAGYGAAPSFIAASATIGNPAELAERLAGVPFSAVTGEGAGAFARQFLFWRPPQRGDVGANEHHSALEEAVILLVELVRAGRTVLLFGRSRVMVERMLIDARARLGPELGQRLSGYKAGYAPEERRRIEAGLRDGRLRAVIATNALELGIDVGALDAVVLAGYPGTIMSTWQQAGRVGRRAGDESLVILVGGDDALDQYYLGHPDVFFGQPSEQAVTDPGNESILLGHLLCAAHEQPLRAAELAFFPPNAQPLLDRLERGGLLRSDGAWRTTTGESPHRQVNIRGTSAEQYQLFAGDAHLATLDLAHLYREAHPGAVYLHNGAAYRVQAIDPAAHQIQVSPEAADLRTDPLAETVVYPDGKPLRTRLLSLGEREVTVTLGPLRVEERIYGYRETVGRGRAASTTGFPDPFVTTLATIGLWLDFPADLAGAGAALHAAEHALVNALPVALLCDRRDVGSTSDPGGGAGGRVYLYDEYEGGIGIAEKAFSCAETIVLAARDLLGDCPCADGCPACVHLAGCGRGNDDLDKPGGLALLQGRSLARQSPKPAPAPPAALDQPPALGPRLQQIAADQLRERLAQAPIAVGEMVELPGYGTAIVRSLQGDEARIETAGAPAQLWVKLSELRRRGA